VVTASERPNLTGALAVDVVPDARFSERLGEVHAVGRWRPAGTGARHSRHEGAGLRCITSSAAGRARRVLAGPHLAAAAGLSSAASCSRGARGLWRPHRHRQASQASGGAAAASERPWGGVDAAASTSCARPTASPPAAGLPPSPSSPWPPPEAAPAGAGRRTASARLIRLCLGALERGVARRCEAAQALRARSRSTASGAFGPSRRGTARRPGPCPRRAAPSPAPRRLLALPRSSPGRCRR
jgi:hypothetical protein